MRKLLTIAFVLSLLPPIFFSWLADYSMNNGSNQTRMEAAHASCMVMAYVSFSVPAAMIYLTLRGRFRRKQNQTRGFTIDSLPPRIS